ncbi:hypothetical protein [Thalassoroseus pseudoceratinae]|uniref:hypothetical protein n=1 Tax=Thalassoroseus pseudoceratinae TaxID=2713176 RepID=UPI00141D8B49|nr:hypothetical protein [Thalassoroseus pseudoceratinae]
MQRIVLGWSIGVGLLLSLLSTEARAQGHFLIYSPPGQYSMDPTGLDHPETYFDANWEPPLVADISFGTITPTAGLFDKVADTGFATRIAWHHPTLKKPLDSGRLFLGWTGSFEYATFSQSDDAPLSGRAIQANPSNPTGSNIALPNPNYSPFQVDALDSYAFGIGPEATFMFYPVNETGPECFVGASFEGLVGWADADIVRFPAGTPAPNAFRAKPPVNDEMESLWGYRGQAKAGVAFADGYAISTSVASTLYRTQAVTNIQDNNWFVTWMVHFEANTQALANGFGRMLGR